MTLTLFILDAYEANLSIIIHVRVRPLGLRCLCVIWHCKKAHCTLPRWSNAVTRHVTNTHDWEEGQIGELTRQIDYAHCRSWNDCETHCYTVATC